MKMMKLQPMNKYKLTEKKNSANTKLGWERHYLITKWIRCTTWSQSRIVLNWTFSLTDKHQWNYLSCILKKNYKNRLWKKQISTCPSERSTSIIKCSRIAGLKLTVDIILLSGYVKVPSPRNYWESSLGIYFRCQHHCKKQVWINFTSLRFDNKASQIYAL